MKIVADAEWTILEKKLHSKGDIIRSPVFALGERHPIKWQLTLAVLNVRQDGMKAFTLVLGPVEIRGVTVFYEVAVYGEHNTIAKTSGEWAQELNEDRGLVHFSFCTTDTPVKIYCCLEVQYEVTTGNIKPGDLLRLESLRMGMWGLRYKRQLTDIVIRTTDEGSVLHCHGCVLAAGSKVFRAMLSNPDNPESQTGIICSQFGFECLLNMVSFLYRDRLDITFADVTLAELLEAAEYYNIPKLKDICQTELMKKVGPKNVVQVLQMARKTNCQELITKCVDIETSEVLLKRKRLKVDLMEVTVPSDAVQSQEKREENTIFDVLWEMYRTQELTDMTILTFGGAILKCHKAILRAGAPELYEAIIKGSIGQLSVDSLRKMIDYVYTGELEYSENPSELLAAAHTYKLGGLKEKCSQILLSNLNAENAVEILVVAWDSDCPALKENAVAVIAKNPPLVSTEQYKNNVLNNLNLSCFVTEQLCRKLAQPLKVSLRSETP